APDQALLLLQRSIEDVRSESRTGQENTLGAVRKEMVDFGGQVTQQLAKLSEGVTGQLQSVTGEVNKQLRAGMELMQKAQTTMGERLDRTTSVVSEVQGSLGKLGEVTQRVLEVGKNIAGLEQILKAPKVRGGLGETFLEQLLSQMLPREHYELQHQFRSGEKVDAVIRLGERLIPVDAKFPLENFQRMLEEAEEEPRKQARRAFVRDVKARVDEISKKYILPDEDTFDFALMYVPAENVYYEIIVRDDKVEDEPLLAYGISKRIIPVSPNSFYAYLQTILLGLKGLRIERNAREIMAVLGRLEGDLEKFREQFDVVGKHLTNAKNKYDDAGQLLARFDEKLKGIEGRGEQPSLPGLPEP
ncbi:MAG TPA: DNA recombination protein RmuC, partial [Methylomirabilota bacterium]|nr:DNA recombination protein RmuC [Methylomirabilota bacterium]